MGTIKLLICHAIASLPLSTISDHCIEGALNKTGVIINTQTSGLVMESEYHTPFTGSYVMLLNFSEPDVNWDDDDARTRSVKKISKLNGNSDEVSYLCKNAKELIPDHQGPCDIPVEPLPLRIIITDKKTGKSVIDDKYDNLVPTGRTSRSLLTIKLNEGDYLIRVFNMKPNPAFSFAETKLFFVRQMRWK